MEKIRKKLIEFGMFELEADAYLKLLKQGESPIEDLTEDNSQYAEVLVALDSLADKDLIKKVQGMDNVYYLPKDPELVFSSLKQKQAQAQISKDKIDQVVLNLNWVAQQNEGVNQNKTLNGYDGVLHARKKIFEGEWNNIYNLTSLHKNIPKNHIQSMLDHVKKKYYLVIPKSDIDYLCDIKDIVEASNKIKIKILEKKFEHKSEIMIFGNLVGFGNIEDEQVFSLIEDESVAKIMKEVFKSIWDQAQDY